MSNKLKIFLFLCCMVCFSLSAFSAPDRYYIDENELDCSQARFKIHTGHNMWIETEALYSDNTGLYTMESQILRHTTRDGNVAYVRQWKCPYCHYMWDEGKPCSNPDCPSRYARVDKLRVTNTAEGIFTVPSLKAE